MYRSSMKIKAWLEHCPTHAYDSISELSVAELVGFLVVEPICRGSSLRLNTGARIFSGFIPAINSDMLSVVDDVPVASEAPVVTSSISRSQL